MNRAYGEVGYPPVPFEDWYDALTADAEYDPGLVWAAMAQGHVVGISQCWSVPFVKDLIVDAAWRRHGLGAALLTLAMKTFAERGADSLDLKTDIENETAQSLYKRLGFVIVERVDG
jgi:ribosomal protein S18 acetylase RimI-like enzyme